MQEKFKLKGINVNNTLVEISNNGHTVLYYLNKNMLLMAREFGLGSSSIFSQKEEITRRSTAIKLHKQVLPKNTLNYSLVILQGDNGLIFAKLTKTLKRVQTLQEMKMKNILEDKDLCNQVSEIFFKHFMLFLFKNIYFDNFGWGEIGESWNKFIKLILKPMQTNNIMVGYDDNDNRHIFADPDWYLTKEELTEVIKKNKKTGIKHSSITNLYFYLFKSAIFYKLASINPGLFKDK